MTYSAGSRILLQIPRGECLALELSRLRADLPSSVTATRTLNAITQLRLRETDECKACGETSEELSSERMLRVNIPEDALSDLDLRDTFENLFKPEDRPSTCANCSNEGRTLSKDIVAQPDLLCVRIVRAPHLLDADIAIPTDLDIHKYVDQKVPGSATYELYAIVKHAGGAEGGHYVTFAKNDRKWLFLNDYRVTPSTLKAAVTKNTLEGFYGKILTEAQLRKKGKRDQPLITFIPYALFYKRVLTGRFKNEDTGSPTPGPTPDPEPTTETQEPAPAQTGPIPTTTLRTSPRQGTKRKASPDDTAAPAKKATSPRTSPRASSKGGRAVSAGNEVRKTGPVTRKAGRPRSQ